MIDYYIAKKYCCEDISLIENYDKASKDLVETWDIHHRMENEGYSMQELKDKGMYYGRPASELIFLTHKEHAYLHSKGRHISEETKIKLSEAKKGEKNPLYGKTGEKCHMYGKTGEKHPRSRSVQQIDKTTGDIIKTWPCAAEVERVLGIVYSGISQCCKGKRKSCGGYGWRYADI